MKLRILIADDHAMVHRGLKDFLNEQIPFAEIEEASNGTELLKSVMLQP